jgi:UDP-3-O-[3-hydroxymyristoyl] N-acetylglucosamine deacetylase/3-hydroxyacyl-[acyl-carrier-protein] dehydratase
LILWDFFSGIGIDNIYVEVDSNEIPGLDGSGLNFMEALQQAGIKEQEKDREVYSVKEPIYVQEDNSVIVALPATEFKISYTLDYNHPILKSGFLELSITPETFAGEIARARTFCLEEEAQALQKQGVGKGATYDNTLVVGKKGVINNTLRFQDEFVRHKILDLIGDLYLFGQHIKGHIIALRSGHSLNLKLVKKLIQQKEKHSSGGIATTYCLEEYQKELDITEIMKILPHREPFLFVDRILHFEHGKRAVGVKNVTINDYFFKGHFPGKPVMPGVIIVEAMAQVGGVMMLAAEENRGKIAYFMAIDKVKFRKTVIPGDQLILEIEAGRIKSRTGQVFGKAWVNGKLVAEAELMFAIGDS